MSVYGKTNFEGVRFGGKAYFDKAVFLAEVSFKNATFNDIAEFEYARFDKTVNFEIKEAKGLINFKEVQIKEGIQLLEAVFKKGVSFNRARFYDIAFFDKPVFEEGKEVIKKEFIASPGHEPGLLPGWLAEQGVSVVIASGMGSRAQSLFSQSRIKVVVNVLESDPERAVRDYLAEKLELGDEACDH